MKQKESSPKRQPYQPPRAEIIAREMMHGVLLVSALEGNGTEGIQIEDLVWL